LRYNLPKKVTRIYDIVKDMQMGIVGVKWRCPSCNKDVGGSMGELKNHIKNIHSNATIIAAQQNQEQ
jgi:hypothetical protein